MQSNSAAVVQLPSFWTPAPDAQCTPLTFAELKKGDKFICFPTPGDNSGHGGLRSGQHLFKKTFQRVVELHGVRYSSRAPHGRACRMKDGADVDFPHSMPVIRVE
ncbi:hypothetical protein HY632_03545 [Candidatus Uhrbacteria bacterium]|nr:hypothetical protein [Candidatus Uhrbacteria bacterium]